MEKVHEIKSAVHQLPEKKRYAEFITAVLSVPVLITVLMLNLNNLRKSNPPPLAQAVVQSSTPSATPRNTPTSTPKSGAKAVIVTTNAPSPTYALTAGCIKEVGPVEISSPDENETIESGPVSLVIKRTGSEYCEIVWSYRINNDPWSEYMDKSVVLYNLSPGQKKVEVKVKSIASSDQELLTRNFVIAGTVPTPTPTASSSGSLNE